MVKVLLIDNYDSFVHNIAQYLGAMGAEVIVMRNDATLDKVEGSTPDRIVLSPGPGHPADSGVCLEILRTMAKEVPTLGVCLGHQAFVYEYGGRIVQAGEPAWNWNSNKILRLRQSNGQDSGRIP